MTCKTLILSLVAVGCMTTLADAAPLAERYMLEGKLSEGEKACQEHLAKNPQDDEARFGLGTIQFLLSFEHLGTSLYQYGLRTERAFPRAAREFRELLPQNPNPKVLTYEEARKVVQTLLNDVKKAEATLAKVKDPDVKLPLHMALIKIDLFGIDQPVNAAFVLGRMNGNPPPDEVKDFVIGFDRGDVAWLRGYCHFLSALGEVILAVDTQEMFERSGHLFFEKIATPHKFLLEGERNFERIQRWDRPLISDVIAFIWSMRFPMKEPARMEASLAHLEAMATQSREMWAHYKAETDDDNEWIPNPRQTGVLQVKVNEEMISTWLKTVEETELVLQGKKLVPFWRGTNPKRGVNIRRVFTEPRTIDPVFWTQGTAATPYLEEGVITEFADARTLGRINNTFGGMNFFGFAFWFN